MWRGPPAGSVDLWGRRSELWFLGTFAVAAPIPQQPGAIERLLLAILRRPCRFGGPRQAPVGDRAPLGRRRRRTVRRMHVAVRNSRSGSSTRRVESWIQVEWLLSAQLVVARRAFRIEDQVPATPRDGTGNSHELMGLEQLVAEGLLSGAKALGYSQSLLGTSGCTTCTPGQGTRNSADDRTWGTALSVLKPLWTAISRMAVAGSKAQYTAGTPTGLQRPPLRRAPSPPRGFFAAGKEGVARYAERQANRPIEMHGCRGCER